MTRVLLLDDHALLRRGMRDALRDEGLRVVGEAGSWNELEPLLRVAADVLVVDINVPGRPGQNILETLKAQRSAPRTLVLSADAQDADTAARALRAGAAGCLNKSCSIAELTEAIAMVAQGRTYAAPAIAARLAGAPAEPARHLLLQRFSDREQQLLALLASGQRLPDIAERLELPPKTVSVYRARLLEKMKLSTNAELAHYAIHHNLVAAPALAG